MKNTLLIIISLAILQSCHFQHATHFNYKKIHSADSSYIQAITVKNDTFFFHDIPVARYTNMELECLEKNCVVEISIEQFNRGMNDTTQVLMNYLHFQHPHSKLEVKVK
jgi:hypothetical protein